jgi:hypothetical protein
MNLLSGHGLANLSSNSRHTDWRKDQQGMTASQPSSERDGSEAVTPWTGHFLSLIGRESQRFALPLRRSQRHSTNIRHIASCGPILLRS